MSFVWAIFGFMAYARMGTSSKHGGAISGGGGGGGTAGQPIGLLLALTKAS